jgi:trigger factor
MATITRENIAYLTDKITVTVSNADYLPAFEKNLKQYAKTATIPGFRKGMVPTGVVKKMYGQGVFVDEVLKTVEKEITNYLETEKLEIFAQPLPLDNDASAINMNDAKDYVFAFEIGLKPSISINLSSFTATKYVIGVTEEAINEDIERLQQRFGNMTEPETISSVDHVLNVTFTEVDDAGNVFENGINKGNSFLAKYFAPSFLSNIMGLKKDDVIDVQLNTAFDESKLSIVLEDLGLDKNSIDDAEKKFKMTITKIGFVEIAALDETLFEAAFPGKEVKTVEDLRNAVKAEIETYFAAQAKNQISDQIYHHLIDTTEISFPESFLLRWLQSGGEKNRTEEEAKAEYPTFINQLKWTLISTQLQQEEKIEVLPNDIKDFAKQQLFQYMGGQMNMLGENNQWVEDYANRMMKDKKYVEESYHRIAADKLFTALEARVATIDENITAEAFAEKVKNHQH